MAVDNIGLVFAANATAALAVAAFPSCRIEDGTTGQGEVFLRFSTMSGADWNSSFEIGLDWQGVAAATEARPDTSYGGWSSTKKTLDLSAVAHRHARGRYEWAVPLSSIVDAGTFDTLGAWGFGTRRYDEIHMRLSIRSLYKQADGDGATASPVGVGEAWVGYVPDYAVSAASFDLDGIRLTLSRSPSWHRCDDRWALQLLSLDGRSLVGSDEVWGSVDDPVVPRSSLRSLPASGTLAVRLRVNASYKARGMTLSTAAGTVALKDLSTCDSPKVAVAVSDGDLVAKIEDSGDRGVPITRAVVRLRGGLSVDEVEVSVPGTATLRLAPQGACTVEAVGTDGKAATSVSKTITATANVLPAQAFPCLLDVETGEAFPLSADVEWSRRREQEMTVEKLAGRSRASSWLGHGADVTGTLAASVIGADAVAGPMAERMASIRRALVRMPDGYRAVCAVTGASTERHVGYVTVSFDLTEAA